MQLNIRLYASLYAACNQAFCLNGINMNNARADVGDTTLYAACTRGYALVVKVLLAFDEMEVNKARIDYYY